MPSQQRLKFFREAEELRQGRHYGLSLELDQKIKIACLRIEVVLPGRRAKQLKPRYAISAAQSRQGFALAQEIGVHPLSPFLKTSQF